MSKNILIEALRADDKTGYLFNANGTFVSYKTGFPALDFNLGCMINVFDENNKVKETYPSLGITAGSIVTIIGKSQVGKTTLAIQIASNIVRPFENGTVIHYDLEGGANYSRIASVSKFTPTEMEDGKYILRQSQFSIEEIKKSIAKIYLEKVNNPSKYQYNTGKLDEFGKEIVTYEPTCIIIDSVASLSTYINENTKDGLKTLEDITSQTEVMRLTAEIGRFLKESIPMMKTANIIMFLINHIKLRPGLGMPQAAELMYLKQDETLPCGKAVQYYTNTMIRLTSVGAEKYTPEEHNFDGFGVQCQFVKNRSNANGTIAPLVFNKVTGYDSLMSSFILAKNLGYVGGNKNGYYFEGHKDNKFTITNIHNDFKENRELYKIMYSLIVPVLEKNISSIKPEEMDIVQEEMDY